SAVFPGASSVLLRRGTDPVTEFYIQRTSRKSRKLYLVPDKAMPGFCIVVHGIVLTGCEHFIIDFTADPSNDRGHVLLRIGARLPQNCLTRNSRLRGLWGVMEIASSLSFQIQRGKASWMQIMLTEECFLIAVNGYHFAKYNHRMPYNWLNAVEVRGDIADISVASFYVSEYPIRLSHSMPVDISSTHDPREPEQGRATVVNEWKNRLAMTWVFTRSFVTLDSLPLPFYGAIPENENLTEGRALRIIGRIRLLPQKFSIELQIGQEVWPQPAVSLHFSPCFLRGPRDKVGKAIITRAAYVKGQWVHSQASRMSTTLRPGSTFIILIACRRSHYELYVNNKPLVNFKYYIKPEMVNIVNIRGDIKLWAVVIE
ncbi:hypothetical protein KR018_008356, partial [Drosophila ironensis]